MPSLEGRSAIFWLAVFHEMVLSDESNMEIVVNEVLTEDMLLEIEAPQLDVISYSPFVLGVEWMRR